MPGARAAARGGGQQDGTGFQDGCGMSRRKDGGGGASARGGGKGGRPAAGARSVRPPRAGWLRRVPGRRGGCKGAGEPRSQGDTNGPCLVRCAARYENGNLRVWSVRYPWLRVWVCSRGAVPQPASGGQGQNRPRPKPVRTDAARAPGTEAVWLAFA
ncbi:MAG: hypothetical protein J3K34DRAFT_408242 [Monoraphidium minutum]|nr:MAG: hypothetical protein J3K34DRAFT_408242 [Monoraphidium minutum]